ncbi:hypothetical protein ATANTOWER_003857 [Ataeniobius toweri]|uniref:Uncharacterized protein n=1 Tax=Ataeniobius toweri TaxID=208326 RepID=A0ABU7B5U3_9TELE|nr:hypothetical protein [Ataeniobius toweri]
MMLTSVNSSNLCCLHAFVPQTIVSAQTEISQLLDGFFWLTFSGKMSQKWQLSDLTEPHPGPVPTSVPQPTSLMKPIQQKTAIYTICLRGKKRIIDTFFFFDKGLQTTHGFLKESIFSVV